jgi:hypothetical protein
MLDTWNNESIEAATSETAPAEQMPYIVYAASKAEGERQAWKWVQENGPGFKFNTVLPNMNVSAFFSNGM